MTAHELAAAVLAIHREDTDGGFCHGCWVEGGYDGAPSWPCRVAQVALDAQAAPAHGGIMVNISPPPPILQPVLVQGRCPRCGYA